MRRQHIVGTTGGYTVHLDHGGDEARLYRNRAKLLAAVDPASRLTYVGRFLAGDLIESEGDEGHTLSVQPH